jgi:glycosyltransferase involved in cell wall biosynthesis
MAKRKVCILHDFFLYRGGAERFDIMAANAVGADLASAYFDKGSYDLRAMGFEGKKIAFSRRIFPSGSKRLPARIVSMLRYAHFKLALSWKTRFLRNYDTVVFSGDTLGAVRNCRPDSEKICYFHSIPRYLFDQRDLYYSKVPKPFRAAYSVVRHFALKAFFRDLAKIDRIYVNGKNLQEYCRKYLGRESEIVYPPVDTKEFRPCASTKKGDYYLSFSKLATLKRVDGVVRAFREMPDKKLLVIYGANDPQKDDVLALAEGAANIECRILKDNSELPDIVARAIATVFVSRNEDFGMVATESMAAGTPVIAADSGGLKETVVRDVTGVFVPEEFSMEDLRRAVSEMSPERAASMRDACVERAKEFGLSRFEKEIRAAFASRIEK